MILIVDPIRAAVTFLIVAGVAVLVIRCILTTFEHVWTEIKQKVNKGVHHEEELTPSGSKTGEHPVL